MTVQGQRPGDRRVRVTRIRPEEVALKPARRARRPLSPAGTLLVAFVVMIAAGTVLLLLPWATEPGRGTDPLTALFTATSAVCVTGLVVVDTATHWSAFGEVVILLLIQVGGFGIMTGSTLLLYLIAGRRTRLHDRVVVQESLGGLELGSVTQVAIRIAAFTLVVELAGAVVLSVAFMAGPEAGPPWHPQGIWWGVFHAVSAFNNAGFDLTGGYRSLTPFIDDWVVLSTVAVLLILGGLGWAIVGDVGRHRSWRRLALETKLVLTVSAGLLLAGTVLIAVIEWNNPTTLGRLPAEQRILNAAFESATLRTAGFTALSPANFAEASLFVVMALMFIGGASGSTAGGIKVNTFGLLGAVIWSSVRGRPSAEVFGRRIPHGVVYRALSVALLAIAFVFLVGLGLAVTSQATFLQTLFEAVSAFGTVGATTGITPGLDEPARVIAIIGMFVGRLGPITLVLALAARLRPVPYRPAIETIRIG
ncbi:MAG TPA: potassium transporter TrkG [candidate division Zixibacteria bacterium]|nr:potassium transporter TrkG [candidate division Zixibacteria bacterium]